MKDPMYNGICLTIIGKDGNKQNVPVAVAYVHKETVDNFACFFCNCIVAGLKLHNRPVFCDRGKQLRAQALLKRLGLKVNLTFCTVHIRFNTMDKFKALKLNLQSVKDDILALQKASTTFGYDRTVSQIADKYTTGIPKFVGEKVVEEHVWSYLRSIHPTDWCLVGNMQPTPDETKWLKDSWDTIPKHGNPLPLFGVRTTSAIEGDNNGLLWSRVRNKLVLGSIMAYCSRVLTVIQKRKKLVKEWKDAGYDVTPHALKVFNGEKLRVAQQTVVSGYAPLFYVFDAFDSRSVEGDAHLYEVNMECGSCTRCTVAEQMKVPCRHIQAVAYWRSKHKNSDLPHYDVKRFFRNAYTVMKMHEAFEAISIRLPLYVSLERTDQVKPPPLYRQTGRSLQRTKENADVYRGKKRKENRGECAGLSCKTYRLQSPPPSVVDEDDESKEIAAYFDDQVTGASTAKREAYICSRCGQPGHNTRSCSTPVGEIEEAGMGILPGIYVVGECPFTACGKSAEYERERKHYQ